MKRKIVIVLILAISVIGAVVFFPYKLENDFCCLAELWSKINHEHHSHTGDHVHAIDPSELVRRYVFPYGVFWWSSLGMGFWSLTYIIKERKKRKNDQNSSEILDESGHYDRFLYFDER